MTDLDKLIEAVELGVIGEYDGETLDLVRAWRTPLEYFDITRLVHAAYHGSLDAALALHNALLPGWVAKPVIGGAGAGVTKWHCEVENWDSGEEYSGDNQPCPARAFLIAILKAYRSETQK